MTQAFKIPQSVLVVIHTPARDVLLIGWLVASVVAALLGRRIARRTLVPVRDAANASQT